MHFRCFAAEMLDVYIAQNIRVCAPQHNQSKHHVQDVCVQTHDLRAVSHSPLSVRLTDLIAKPVKSLKVSALQCLDLITDERLDNFMLVVSAMMDEDYTEIINYKEFSIVMRHVRKSDQCILFWSSCPRRGRERDGSDADKITTCLNTTAGSCTGCTQHQVHGHRQKGTRVH